MSKWHYGTPLNTGDYFLVVIDGKELVVFFCPQLGWVDEQWHPIDIDKVTKYKDC